MNPWASAADAAAATLAPAPVRAPVAASCEPVHAYVDDHRSDGLGGTLAIVFGGFIVLILAYVGYERLSARPAGSGRRS